MPPGGRRPMGHRIHELITGDGRPAQGGTRTSGSVGPDRVSLGPGFSTS